MKKVLRVKRFELNYCCIFISNVSVLMLFIKKIYHFRNLDMKNKEVLQLLNELNVKFIVYLNESQNIKSRVHNFLIH